MEENKRLSIKEYQEKHQDEIQKFNQFANQEEILNKVIDHFLFTGNNENSHPVDAIIYGTQENFICLKKQDIVNHLLTQNEKFNSIHFSSLVLQPWTRNLNFNPKYEYRRNFVQIKWYRLEEIFLQIKTSLYPSITDHVGKEKNRP